MVLSEYAAIRRMSRKAPTVHKYVPRIARDNQPDQSDELSSGPLLDRLVDDSLCEILTILARMPKKATGAEWQWHRRAHSRDALNLAATCRRMRAVLWEGCQKWLAPELRGRERSDVEPLLRDPLYPYCIQLRKEEETRARSRMLRKCETAMAFHCAGKHCCGARKDVRKALGLERDVVTPVVDHGVVLFSAATDTDVVFCVVSQPHPDFPTSHISAVTAAGGCVATVNMCWSEDPVLSEPLYIAAEPHGRACAFIRETEDGATDLRVAVLSQLKGQIPTDEQCTVIPIPRETPAMGMIRLKAQAIWWSQKWSDGDMTLYLNVAWSTSFVHPAGHCGAYGGVVNEHEKYMFCKYEFDGSGFLDLDTRGGWPWVMPQSGRLLTVSSTCRGTRVAALVRRRPTERWQTHYYVAVHDNVSPNGELRHPSIWKCKGKRRAGKDGHDWGPSAAAISPAGDSITVLHRTSGSVIAEVLDLDAGSLYTSTNSRDVTEWFSRSDVTECDILGELLGLDSDSDEDEFPNKVKLPYAIGYSSCGSNVHLVDRRPLHGCKAPHFSTVLLDLTSRRTDKMLRAVPLFRERQSQIKAVQWSAATVWVQGRRGLVCVN